MQARQEALEADRPLGKAEKSEIVALFNSGDIAEIEVKATDITRRYPDDVFGWNILGMYFLRQGNDSRALPNLEQAIALSPHESDIHNNLGVALMHLGRLDEAVERYRQAVNLKPDSLAALANLGNALTAAGRTREAATAYRKALAINPGQHRIQYNLGNILKDDGKLEEAEACYHAALAQKPDYAAALTNLALLQTDLGRPQDAETCAQQALAVDPDRVEALNLLAMLHLTQRNDPMAALGLVIHSLEVEERPETKLLFVDCIERAPASRIDGPLRDLLQRALSEPWGRPNGLAAIGARVVRDDAFIGACLDRAAGSWPTRLTVPELYGPAGLAGVSANRLLACLLEAAPVGSLRLERFLTLARFALLDAIDPQLPVPDVDDDGLAFHASLARQCSINEYVFDQTDDELARAHSLREALIRALDEDRPVPALWLVAVAAYFPLTGLLNGSRLFDRVWPECVTALLDQQIRQPERERQIRHTLPHLTAIKDAVSVLVRRQYEENPYPRWVKAAPACPPVTLDDYLRRLFPLGAMRPTGHRDSLDILVAGCGTGQHSLETARRFAGARVLAIDLSLTSLSYAQRKTEELGVTSIEYAQADILKLGSISRRFDVIESSGVLHHLADPFTGWRILLSLLRPGGCMRLGFYSKQARRGISRLRATMPLRGRTITADAIRKRRQEIIDSRPEEQSGQIMLDDFFSLSGCRDLLFNVQEHCLTLIDIKAFLFDHSLDFLGFCIDPGVLTEYRSCFPEDPAATNLTNWHYFEMEHPDTFIEMYQFWVQKAG